MSVWVVILLNRTVLVDSDSRFDNMSGSHLQSQKQVVSSQLMVLNSGPIS